MVKKLKGSNIFNCEDIGPFLDVVVQLMQYSGISKTRFYLCEYENIRFLTKLGFYSKSAYELLLASGAQGEVIPEKRQGTTPKYTPGFDTEIGILEEFRKTIIYENVSPHIVELVYSKICKMSTLAPRNCDTIMASTHASNNIEDDLMEVLCKYKSLATKGLAYDRCMFLVIEHLSMTLDALMKRSYTSAVYTAIIRAIIFQITYTLYAIRVRYPKFRHNDLHSENVMILVDTDYKFGDPIYDIYKIQSTDVEYAIPYFGLTAKIIDFGSSSLPEKGFISFAIADKLHMNERADNDILLLFHWIYQVSVVEHKSTEIDAILSALEPNRSYVRYNTEYIASCTIPTYEEMLQSKVFKEYVGSNIPLQSRRKTYTC